MLSSLTDTQQEATTITFIVGCPVPLALTMRCGVAGCQHKLLICECANCHKPSPGQQQMVSRLGPFMPVSVYQNSAGLSGAVPSLAAGPVVAPNAMQYTRALLVQSVVPYLNHSSMLLHISLCQCLSSRIQLAFQMLYLPLLQDLWQ